MRSLAFKETALGLECGSLASNGETSTRACSLKMRVSRRIEKFFCAKRAAAIRTRVADTGSGECRMRGRRQGFLPRRTGHGLSRPAAIPQIVVEETAWRI